MSSISWLIDENGVRGKEWNPTLGCSPKSIECMRCYAAALSHRGMCEEHRGLTRLVQRRNAGGKLVGLPVYNGVVTLHPERLDKPKHWKKGRRVFVNSMSDLFHEEVPFDFIAAVFKTMSECPQHTFIVLTKWPERAVEWFAWARKRIAYFTESGASWPLPNVHLGVSAGTRRYFIERVPLLMECDAAIRCVSLEPLLGPIGDMRPFMPHPFNREPHCDWCEDCVSEGPRDRWARSRPDNHGPFLDWVIAGLESGSGARDGHLEWLDEIVEQVLGRSALFIKQLGARPHRDGKLLRLADTKGEDMDEWKDRHLAVRQLPRKAA